MNPLDGCYLKLARSQQHLYGLNEAAQRFFKADGGFFFSFTGKSNAQRSKYVFTVDHVPELPTLEWGIIIGDAVHCLRSALDQLVYGAATDPTSVCAFPIYNTRKAWEIESPRLLWSVPDPLRAFIERAQPYHLTNAADTHPFAMLRLLSNLDKHRTVPTTALLPVLARTTVTATVGIKSHKTLRIRPRTSLEHGAEFAEIEFEPDDSGKEPKMDIDSSHFDFEVAFGRALVPSALYLKPVVRAFNEKLGSYVFGFIRKASEIIEPDVARPDRMTFQDPAPPKG